MFLSALFEPITRREVLGVVIFLISAGTLVSQAAYTIVEANDRSKQAIEMSKSGIEDRAAVRADGEETKRSVRRLEERVEKMEWMLFKVLETVDPKAARWIQPPPNPVR